MEEWYISLINKKVRMWPLIQRHMLPSWVQRNIANIDGNSKSLCLEHYASRNQVCSGIKEKLRAIKKKVDSVLYSEKGPWKNENKSRKTD